MVDEDAYSQFENLLRYSRLLSAKNQKEIIENIEKDMRLKGYLKKLQGCKEFDRLLELYGDSTENFTKHKQEFVDAIGEEAYMLMRTLVAWTNQHNDNLFNIKKDEPAQTRTKVAETKSGQRPESKRIA